MLNSSSIGDSSKVSARRSFSQTCALLSRYMKESQSFGDLSFHLAAKIDGRDSVKSEFTQRTMDLFPVNEKVKEEKEKSVPSAEITVDSSEIKSAPLTILYDGQVIVFNDFPAHKMKQIMDLANSNSNYNENRINSSKLDFNVIHTMQELAIEPLIPTVISDLPQKRRDSLQRFMGKRKERVAAKAPYSMNKPENVQQKLKPNENNSWLELATGFR